MRKQTKLWTTKDSSRVRICDMDDEHLVSCVNLLRRWGQIELDNTIRHLLNLNISGEHAQDDLESTLDELAGHEWHQHVPGIFWNMISDIKRRILLRPGIVKNLIGIPNWILEQ